MKWMSLSLYNGTFTVVEYTQCMISDIKIMSSKTCTDDGNDKHVSLTLQVCGAALPPLERDLLHVKVSPSLQ